MRKTRARARTHQASLRCQGARTGDERPVSPLVRIASQCGVAFRVRVCSSDAFVLCRRAWNRPVVQALTWWRRRGCLRALLCFCQQGASLFRRRAVPPRASAPRRSQPLGRSCLTRPCSLHLRPRAAALPVALLAVLRHRRPRRRAHTAARAKHHALRSQARMARHRRPSGRRAATASLLLLRRRMWERHRRHRGALPPCACASALLLLRRRR